ncbi:glycosyltransferase [Sulfobacillus thermosulfidooxidans]|uniref:glycosyltransferase n=1 Tax=Sulfobacillus thermosulfidooxidans TaxID=28034 RepID=UPI0006B469C9|nr:glycosyltransferase [Sulfobacillus thermosulfidooxidans]
MMKRVLQISLRADPLNPLDGGETGGQQVIVRQMGRNLQHLGYAVDIITLRQQDHLPERYSFGHLGQVIRLTGWEGRLSSDEDWHRNQDAIIQQALTWIREQHREYHIIHSHFWISGMVAVRLAHELGIPWIHSPYKMGQWIMRPGDEMSSIRLQTERQLIEQAQGVVVPYLKESEMIHQMAPKVPIYVVPPAVDITNFFVRDAGPLLRGLGLNKPPILYVGRLNKGRGIQEVLEVMTRTSLPLDLTLLVIGGSPGEVVDGQPTNPTLRSLAEKLNGHVRFLGPMPHHAIATYMGSSTVLIAPNQGATLGMAVIEAMASGCAVVGTNVPGVEDWIEPGFTGILVERSRIDQLWQNALELWQTPNRARQMGTNGQEIIQRHHTVNHMAQRLHVVYEEVASSGRHQAGVGY